VTTEGTPNVETEGLNIFPQKSEKLRELCTCLTTEKVPFYVSRNNWKRNSRYQYYIICSRYTKPYNFPVFLNPPISKVTEQPSSTTKKPENA
jgi:hypothetical protein